LGIVEIIVILAVALIVIPPENLPDVMRAAGKILRELRLASNLVVRELGGALDQPSDPEATRPINTMKPSGHVATSSNIAQSQGPADAATSSNPPSASSSDASTAASPASAAGESMTTPAAPKAGE
jgi:sec-independent protein translocase protein TatB